MVCITVPRFHLFHDMEYFLVIQWNLQNCRAARNVFNRVTDSVNNLASTTMSCSYDDHKVAVCLYTNNNTVWTIHQPKQWAMKLISATRWWYVLVRDCCCAHVLKPDCVHTVAVLFCGLSRQHSDLGTSLLNELLQVDLSKLFCQQLQLLLLLLWRKIHHDNKMRPVPRLI